MAFTRSDGPVIPGRGQVDPVQLALQQAMAKAQKTMAQKAAVQPKIAAEKAAARPVVSTPQSAQANKNLAVQKNAQARTAVNNAALTSTPATATRIQSAAPAPAINSPSGGFNSSLSIDGSGVIPTGDPALGAGGGVQGAPVIPDVASDATYQQQKAELMKALADYQAQMGLANSQYDTNYSDSLRHMGWNGSGFDRNNMQGLYGQALSDNQNDFGARGLLNSGQFAAADSNLNNQFADRKTSADTARQQFLDTQNQGFQNYKGQNDLAVLAAQREAAARLAAQYGVGLSAVPIGAV